MANGIPVWNVGQVLAASDVDNWFVPIAVYKGSDTSRANNNTITADPDLSVTVPGAGLWEFAIFLDYEGGPGGSSDMQFSISSPGTLHFSISGNNAGGTPADESILRTVSGPFTLGTNNATILKAAKLYGYVATTGSGALTFSWAQNSLNATPTIVHKNSFLILRRLA